MQFQGYRNIKMTNDGHPTFTVDLVFDTGLENVTLNYAPMVVQYGVDALLDSEGKVLIEAAPEIVAPRFNLNDQKIFDQQIAAWAADYIASKPEPAVVPAFTEGAIGS